MLIRWHIANSNDSSCQALINGIYVGETTLDSWSVQPILMKKGDVVSFALRNTKISNTSRFIPYN